jgi:putative polyketide hydroxylase
VHDAHNLAWKLAAVLHGTAGPGLLATYDAERRPVGEFTVEQSYARYVGRVAPYLGTAGAQQVVDDLYLELGYRYESTAVIAGPGDDGRADDGLGDAGLAHRHPRDLRAQPGSRAPHVFLNRDGARVSTLDLFGQNFVLLAGPRGAAWPEAARVAAGRLGLGLDAYQVAGGDDEAVADGILVGDGNRFRSAYRMAPDSAVLVRPDGYVAWRAADGTRATSEVMAAVLSRVLHREDA